MHHGDATTGRINAGVLMMLLLLVASHAIAANELDTFITRANLPERYAGYVPGFAVEETTLTFRQSWGAEQKKLWLIKDGRNYVGYVRIEGSIYDDAIYMTTFQPGSGTPELRFPRGRLHHDTEFGFAIGNGYCYAEGQVMPKTSSNEFKADSQTLTLTRSYSGQVNTLVLRVDPRLGYVVDATMNIRPGVTRVQAIKAVAVHGGFPVWPDDKAYSVTMYPRPNSTQGYTGFYINPYNLMKAQNNSMGSLRDNSFVAFLKEEQGWGVALTRSGGGAAVKSDLCGPHNTIHLYINVPADRIVKQSLVGLPPELVAVLEPAISLQHQAETACYLPIGEPTGFEDQPRSLTAVGKGIADGGFSISTGGYQGGKCLRFSTTQQPISPNLLMKYVGSRYRMEAMLKVDAGKTYISMVTKEWSSVRHTDKQFTWYYSDTVTAADGWRKVSVEIGKEAWDPFVSMVFHAEGGTAYIDDFRFVAVDTLSSARADNQRFTVWRGRVRRLSPVEMLYLNGRAAGTHRHCTPERERAPGLLIRNHEDGEAGYRAADLITPLR